MDKMNKIWALLLMLAVSTFFIHVPHAGQIGFILNPEIKLSYNQYFWMLGEHLIMIVLSLIIWDESQDYKEMVFIFVLIQIADTIAFVLSYTDPLRDYFFTFNFIKLLVFGLAIGIHLWKTHSNVK